MKKALKRIGLGLLVFIAAIMVYAVLGMGQTLELKLSPVDLSGIPDGSYTGQYDCYRFSNTVRVAIANGRIENILSIKGPNGRETIRQDLTDRIIKAQSPAVDAVSGATADSKAFLKAVENSLQTVRFMTDRIREAENEITP